MSSPFIPGRRRYTDEERRLRHALANQRYYAQRGCQPNARQPWLPEELALLRNPGRLTDVQLAAQLGRSVHAVENRRYIDGRRRREVL